MVVEGGMGTVTQELQRAAIAAGVRIHTGKKVRRIETSSQNGAVTALELETGDIHPAQVVVVNADPFRMQRLVGSSKFSPEFNSRLQEMHRPGNTMKVGAISLSSHVR